MKITEPHIEDIITRHLDGRASTEDLSLFNAWLRSDPGNIKVFESIKTIWEESSLALNLQQFDHVRAWDKINSRVHDIPAHKPGKVINLFRGVKMVAASLLMLICISGLLYFLFADPVVNHHQVIASAGNKRISLPDGSVVELREGSSLSYPFSFNDRIRQVTLAGEAYFQVSHNPAKPFRIHTSKAMVEVLGTSFLVRSSDTLDQVVVTSGKVKFSNLLDSNQQVILTTGHKGQLKGRTLTEKTVNNLNDLAWQKGVLEFKDTPLDEIVDNLNHFYNAQISMSPTLREKAPAILVTARFEQQSLEAVLEEIQLTTGLSLARENQAIILFNK